MFKRILKKGLDAVFDRPLPPPSGDERTSLSELQRTFRNLPVLETTNALPSESAWLCNMNRLRELVLKQDPRGFLRWNVVSGTMFVGNARYICKELSYLKRLPDWTTRWRPAIKESQVGHPIPFILFPASSGNLIHHAYHVARFEEATKLRIDKMDFVFEFGGGYGSMCRLFHNLGFTGRYLMFDTPSFSALQVYYLKTLGLSVHSLSHFGKLKAGIACISDPQQLTTTLNTHLQARSNMFIATWSISETPANTRDFILSLTSDVQSFLVGYQDSFGEVDNLDYFSNWQKAVKCITWHTSRLKHIPGNNYLFGIRTSNWNSRHLVLQC